MGGRHHRVRGKARLRASLGLVGLLVLTSVAVAPAAHAARGPFDTAALTGQTTGASTPVPDVYACFLAGHLDVVVSYDAGIDAYVMTFTTADTCPAVGDVCMGVWTGRYIQGGCTLGGWFRISDIRTTHQFTHDVHRMTMDLLVVDLPLGGWFHAGLSGMATQR